MGLVPVEIGLTPIFMAVLLGPLLVKKIERNLEAFLLIMGACAIALSRSWHIDLIEEAVQEPVLIGIVLSVLVAGLTAHYLRPHFLLGVNEALLDGITMKVIFLEIVVVLGLSAAIITPVLPFFVLVEAVNHLPLLRKTRAAVTALGCLSIFLGAALGLMEESSSTIVSMKMHGSLPSAGILPLEMQSLYIMLSILLLGFLSIFLTGENVNARGIHALEMKAYGRGEGNKNAAIWSARVFMFTGALLLVGVAFGVRI